MKTGQCKFGSTCKFDHPQPGAPSVPSPAPAFYSTVQPSSVPSTHQYPTLASWQVGRPPMVPAGSYMSGSYGPMLVSPGVVPMQAWSPYPVCKNIWLSFPDLVEEVSNRNANYMQIFDRPDNFKCFLSLYFHIIPS